MFFALGALVAAVAAVGALLAPGGLAQDKGKGGDDPLKPNTEWAADGVIAETLKDNESEFKVACGKSVTVMIDLDVKKYAVRLDRAERRGPPPVGAFKLDRRATVLGREFEQQSRTPGGFITTALRVSPWSALVVGEGFEPKEVLPAAKAKFGEKIRWWKSKVARFDAPDNLWVKGDDGKERLVTISRDDRMLVTAAYESDVFSSGGQLRKALAKGQPVRFKGMIQTVLYTDSKGKLVDDTRKPGVRAEVHLAPARLALLDATYGYEMIETPESF